MHIIENGSKLAIAQLGPDFLMFERPQSIKGLAEIVIVIDGMKRTRRVRLENGATPARKKILFPEK